MNAPVDLRMTSTAVLDWIQHQDGRYELVDGRPIAMTGGTRGHTLIWLAIAMIMRSQLDRTLWNVMAADMALEVGDDDIRYPDVVVEPAGGALEERSTNTAVLAIEVLSPSSADTDLDDKPSEYTALPDIQAYIVFAQDEPKAWLWLRSAGAFPPGRRPVSALDQTIEVPALGLSIPLAEVYRRLLPAAQLPKA